MNCSRTTRVPRKALPPIYANPVARCPYDQTPEAKAERERRIEEQTARVEREQGGKRAPEREPAQHAAKAAILKRWRATPYGKASMAVSRLRSSLREIDATHDPAMHAKRRALLAERLEVARAELDELATAEGRTGA